MNDTNKNLTMEIQSDVFEMLVKHLQNKTEVQNIDLMNLADFCRNCLSKWYVSAAKEKGIEISYDEARKIIYGMPYNDWKSMYQKEATKEQLEKFNSKENK
ncbi:MAG: hypothetical protein CMQ81_04040 [Gammaproteobacteria bacterium]|jgi:hypothetical protein|nr:hypothetical protein [Gammaproteobacteria bacterium]|tara:strand:+ start:464 stop:766 length:303 start_codon:yes stop_codon:yes gene_type:complete